MDLLDELWPLELALEKGVHDDHVWSELADLGDRPTTIGQHVEELDGGLRVEQAADVLRDLGYVFDDEQAGLIPAGGT